LKSHSLRPSTGSWLAMQGVSQVVIRDILRHASTETTEKYMHVADGMKQNAMEETFGSS